MHRTIDVAAFREEMRDAGIEEVVGPTLQAYLEETVVREARVRQTLADGDSEQLARAAHAMRSAAVVLRADRLTDVLERLERAAYAGAQESYERLVAEALEASAEVVEVLQRELNGS